MGKFFISCMLFVWFSLTLQAQNVISLNGAWELSYWKQPSKPVRTPIEMQKVDFETIPAKVPGNVELDLLAVGMIPDPMIGSNVWEVRKYRSEGAHV